MLPLFNDLRFGFRRLMDRPGFTAVAVLTLGLGIGAATAMFSLLDAMYWRAFPGASDANHLVAVETLAPDGSLVRSSWLDFREIREQSRQAVEVAAHDDVVLVVGDGERARPVFAELVSSNYFTVLGVNAARGRAFSAGEHAETPGANPVAAVSHSFWLNELHGNTAVLGQTVRVNRHDLTVIGVMPPEFRGAMGGRRTDLWVPFSMGVELAAVEKDTFKDSTLRNVYLFGRLAPGATAREAQAVVSAAAARLSELDPTGHKGFGAVVEPMWRARIHGRSAFLQPLLVLLAVSVAVLVIVCANVTNLLLSRSVDRQQEFGVRMALGAGVWGVARLICAEALLLSVMGAALGVWLAQWMSDSVTLLLPSMARADAIPVTVDSHVLLFAIVMCVGAACAASIAPVLLVLRSDVNETIREGGRSGRAGRRSHGIRWALILAEIAVAEVVLISAGLFYRSYHNAAASDTGFDRKGVLIADLAIAGGGYSLTELENFCLRLKDELSPLAGVQAVSYADYAPLWSSDGAYANARPEGYQPRSPADFKVHRTSIAPGYFSLLKIPLMDGRDFTESDIRGSAPVMIVDQAFANRFYDGASPVGRRVQVWKKWVTIVGLVRDSRYFSFTEPPRPHFYLPFRQSYQLGQRIVFFVRANGDPAAMIPALRRAAVAVDPNASAFTAAPLVEYNSMLLLPQRVSTSVLNVLSVIAFVLAGVGLYGVMSYWVSQRTKELGIRMALGARPSELLGSVVKQGLLLAAAGVAIGLALSLGVMRLVSDLLVGVRPTDPLVLGAATVFLVCVAAMASFVPALRATQVDPWSVLRPD